MKHVTFKKHISIDNFHLDFETICEHRSNNSRTFNSYFFGYDYDIIHPEQDYWQNKDELLNAKYDLYFERLYREITCDGKIVKENDKNDPNNKINDKTEMSKINVKYFYVFLLFIIYLYMIAAI